MVQKCMYMQVSIRPEFSTLITHVSHKAHFFFFIYIWPFMRLSAQLNLRSHTYIYISHEWPHLKLFTQLSLHTHTFSSHSHISHINHYACVFIILITSHISSYYIKWLADTWVPIFIIHYNICSINHSTVSQ